MQIVICDDSTSAVKRLLKQLQSISANNDWPCQYHEFYSPKKLLEADLSSADVIFLDIDMPEINGIDAAQLLRTRYPEVILVFVTGFIQYARDGYKAAAFRYLMKDSLTEELPDCMMSIQKKLFENQETIEIPRLEYTAPELLHKIYFFEGTAKRHVYMHTTDNKIECLGKLLEYDEKLSNRGFLRIQRSYLVNMRHILWINNYQVCLDNGIRLKASERNYPKIMSKYLSWKGTNL